MLHYPACIATTLTSDSIPDSGAAFEALCQHIRAELGDSVRRSIGEMVARLRNASTDKASANQQASALWSNISERIRAAHQAYDSQLRLRQEQNTDRADDDSPAWAFAARLDDAVRERPPQAFASVICAAISLQTDIGRTRDTHPLDSFVLCHAFATAVSDVVNDPEVAIVLDDELLESLAEQIAGIYTSAAQFAQVPARRRALPLDEQGLPIGYDQTSQEPADSTDVEVTSDTLDTQHVDTDFMPTAEPGSENSQPPSVGYAEHAVSADEGSRQLGQSVLAQAGVGTGLTVVTTLHPVAEMERDAQQFAHAVGELAYSRECRGRYFAQIRARLDKAGALPTQLALVDLVDAMFNYAIDDRRLTDSARPLVWRLQQPVLMLTLLDSAYMSEADRSLRALVENVGAIANAFGDDLTRGTELYRRLETIVRAIEVISNVLYLRGNVLARQVVIEFDRAAGGISQLVQRVERERQAMEATPGRRNRRDYSRRPGRDQERAVTDQLSATVAAKTSGQSLPESVHQFLDKVWLRYLRTTLLRDGADSAEYQSAVGAVDELVWSLRIDDQNQGRRELAQRIPRLIDRLTRGMHEIGENEDEYQAFFDELFVIHLQKLQRRRDPAHKPSTRRHTNQPASIPTRADATEYDVSQDVPVLDEALETLPDTEAMISESTLSAIDASEPASIEFEATDTLMADGPPTTDVDDVIDRSTGRYRSGGRDTLKPLIEIPAHRAEEHSTLIRTTQFDELPGTGGMTTQIAQPSTEVAGVDDSSASNDDALANDPLMGHLARTDLSDLPSQPRFQRGATDALMKALVPGVWVQMRGLTDQSVSLKVAWVSEDRAALLFVRHPDSRVIARESDQVRSLIDQGRLRLMRAERVAGAS